MATKPYVLIIGGSGKTGRSILNGLLEDGHYRIGVLVRPESLAKPATFEIKAKGVDIVVGDISQPDKLDLSHVDIIVSAIYFSLLLDQIPLIKHAKSSGVKRFIPCDWGTASDPSGDMALREVKETVRQAVKNSGIPYTFIDVGWWYQVALPGGVIKHRYGNGDVKTAFTDSNDIGKFVAKILSDDRTIGKYVFIWGEELSQNEIISVANKYSKTEVAWEQQVSHDEVKQQIKQLRDNLTEKNGRISTFNLGNSDFELLVLEYAFNCYIAGHNTVHRAKEIYGALDARELYPNIKPNSFDTFTKDHFAKERKGSGTAELLE